MDKEMMGMLKPEVSRLFGEIVDTAIAHGGAERHLEFSTPLNSEYFAYGGEIAVLLEEHFPNAEIFATLDVEALPEMLNVKVVYPPRYEVDARDGRWFVDSPFEDCWYFEVANGESARSLAKLLNGSPYARNLRRLRPSVGTDEASLRLLLLGFRGQGIEVTTFAHKGTGIFDRDNLLK
ncbi:hypothetical protein GCM10009504_08390 [Pseudomonas laurentiana]|uniref:Uncharacterized protein n=1 Tax=Pseudomonas laurentiana TaxID=2364649 RepID=A0A6I5RPB1_9PSED|nr:hypothetical protein [Pseudomonas laurentiana]NES09733.1 hypothetical protein [Pseudomonas laurentiana]GGU53858.1 hypothetical protein GCM10009504_08390 [Pseudomonas laurentiana]